MLDSAIFCKSSRLLSTYYSWLRIYLGIFAFSSHNRSLRSCLCTLYAGVSGGRGCWDLYLEVLRKLPADIRGLKNISSKSVTRKPRGHRLVSSSLMMYNTPATYMTASLWLSGTTSSFQYLPPTHTHTSYFWWLPHTPEANCWLLF